jgi:hypothetical protein
MGNFGIKDMEYGSIITKEFVDGSLQPVFLQFYSEKDFYEVLDALEEWQPVTRGSITMKSGLGKKYQGPVHWFPVVYDAYGNDVSKPNWWKPFLGHDE